MRNKLENALTFVKSKLNAGKGENVLVTAIIFHLGMLVWEQRNEVNSRALLIFLSTFIY